jgi:hypothetical protein
VTSAVTITTSRSVWFFCQLGFDLALGELAADGVSFDFEDRVSWKTAKSA